MSKLKTEYSKYRSRIRGKTRENKRKQEDLEKYKSDKNQREKEKLKGKQRTWMLSKKRQRKATRNMKL